MPTTRSTMHQTDLKQLFPVRKKTPGRLTRKTKVNVENTSPIKSSVSPLKRNAADDAQLDVSPSKQRPLSHGSPCSPVTPIKDLLSPNNRQPLSPHKDVLVNRITPSRRRTLDFGSSGKLETKKVEPNSSKACVAMKQPGTPVQLFKQPINCYQQAKKVLHTALPDRLPCREKERREVEKFLKKHLGGEIPGSLYISGKPGTGKTAIVSTLVQSLADYKCEPVFVNCMSVLNPKAIFNKIISELDRSKESKLTENEAKRKLEKIITSSGPMIFLMLDEIDQLDSRDKDILYTIFEWRNLADSRLVLIGIANALDMTDRILPRLKARPQCRPETLIFPPYTKDQIATVLKDRLQSLELEGHHVIEPKAVELCARKVAAVAGDMRKALEICRRAVEAVEAEVRKQTLLSPVVSPSKKPPPKKIGVAHVLRIVNTVDGNAIMSSDETFPLQQKLAMCTLLIAVRHGRTKEITLGKFHEYYSAVCRGQSVQPHNESEFFSMCELMETRGILRIKKSKNTKSTAKPKVNLATDEKELEARLKDRTLLGLVLEKGIYFK